jgi:hypothetical protein
MIMLLIAALPTLVEVSVFVPPGLHIESTFQCFITETETESILLTGTVSSVGVHVVAGNGGGHNMDRLMFHWTGIGVESGATYHVVNTFRQVFQVDPSGTIVFMEHALLRVAGNGPDAGFFFVERLQDVSSASGVPARSLLVQKCS